MSFKVPVVGIVKNTGASSVNSISVTSPYEGKFTLYEYDTNTRSVIRVTLDIPGGGTTDTIPIQRRFNTPPMSIEEQRTPASAQIKANPDASGPAYGLQSDFNGGFIVSDVPCMVIVNSSNNTKDEKDAIFKGSSGNLVVGVKTAGDETLMFGISPPELRCKVKVAEDGLLYKQTLSAGGLETWVLA